MYHPKTQALEIEGIGSERDGRLRRRFNSILWITRPSSVLLQVPFYNKHPLSINC